MKAEAVDQEARAWNRRIALAIAVFFLLGVGLFVLGVCDRMRAGHVDRWRTAEASVVAAEVWEIDNSDHATYRDRDGRVRPVAGEPRRLYVLGLDYELTVGGETFAGSGAWGASKAERSEISVEAAPRRVTVYYHPDDPGDSWMTPPDEQAASAWIPIVAGAVIAALAAGVGSLWIWIERRVDEPSEESRRPTAAPADLETGDVAF